MAAIQEIYTNSDNFIPKNEYILVKPEQLEKEEKTESGLIIAINKNNSVMDRPSFGKIIKLGEELKEKYDEGDSVVFPSTDGLDLKFNDGLFLLIRESSVIGLIKQ